MEYGYGLIDIITTSDYLNLTTTKTHAALAQENSE